MGHAERLSMAPEAVLHESLAYQIAYSRPTSLEALEVLGVRIEMEALKGLQALIISWKKENEGAAASPESAEGGESGGAMELATTFTPTQKWRHAIYKPAAKGKPPVWEVSWTRFQQKHEHAQAIATNQDNGKPIKVG